MRKILFTLASIIMVASVSFADNALYIYRNDGRFNAFLDSDIDSMAYSTIDTAGVDHQRHVTQLIYTPDSLYQIPLSAIDSIAFTERPVKYTPQVVKITEEYLPYILSADSLQIQFSTTLPSNLRPYNGDILLYEGFSETFPNGFVGRITDITETDEKKIVVICDKVSITDVYQELVLIYDQTVDNVSNEDALLQQTQYNPKFVYDEIMSLPPLEISLKEDSDISFDASYQSKLRVRLIVKIDSEEKYADFSITPIHKLSGTINANLVNNLDFHYNKDRKKKLFSKSIPLYKIFRLEFEIIPYFKGELKGNASLTIDAVGSTTYGVKIKDILEGDISPYVSKSDFLDNVTANTFFNIHGEISGGLIFNVSLESIGELLDIDLDLSVGPKAMGDLYIDTDAFATTGDQYEALKDTKLKVSIDSDLSFRLKPFNPLPIGGFTLIGKEWYLYPLFSTPTYTQGDNKSIAIIKTTPSRDLLMPVQIGMRLTDEQGKITTQYTSSTTYRNPSSSAGEYSEQFERIKPDVDYTFSPMFKIFGFEMQANPTKQVQIEVEATTGEASDITDNKAVVSGYGDCLETANSVRNLGIVYSTSGTPDINNGTFVSSGLTTSGDFSITLNNLESETTYYYRTCLNLDGKYYYGNVSTFKTAAKEDEFIPGQEVDLGLSVNWAGWNVGASSPEEYGGYYAWGETEEKSNYSEDTYKYYYDTDGDGDEEYANIGSDISGTQYDVARAKWGGSWRMPTYDEFSELRSECTWTWMTYKGVNGYKVTGPNGNSIFLPSAGRLYGTYFANSGGYWCGALRESYGGNCAYILSFGGGYNLGPEGRDNGLTVRPVK